MLLVTTDYKEVNNDFYPTILSGQGRVVNVEESSVSFEYLQESNLESAKTILMQNGYPEIGIENSIATKAKSFVSCAVGKMS